ncbi:hypothetical protein IPF89_01045 [Candidatus Saccharibacteria bacterium]|nr:MAG: hypothetical protein IPF89_01045 [Candidatus Saccharibacteria bacterium]
MRKASAIAVTAKPNTPDHPLGCSATREADDECHENDPEQRVVDQNQDEHVPLLTTTGQARTIIVIIA